MLQFLTTTFFLKGFSAFGDTSTVLNGAHKTGPGATWRSAAVWRDLPRRLCCRLRYPTRRMGKRINEGMQPSFELKSLRHAVLSVQQWDLRFA